VKIEDGRDSIFGGDGHDWIVGGTNLDYLFGGRGDDYIQADDNLDTAGGLNTAPDEGLFGDRDYVYGGEGLDVMVGNTGNDRMYDWSGEFNSFIVPFKPFGSPTVNRMPSPSVYNFISLLGLSAGADATLAEPFGELGFFTQSDEDWGNNHGAPRDPQPGNGPGSRDTQGIDGGTTTTTPIATTTTTTTGKQK
jgi:hypothetical protein